jgi:isopentenyl diphosphate isomerase/L-lactate dehydrogenase-like FMN-dependent dehydrogenase
MRDLGSVISLRSLEAVARDVLSAAHFDYIAGGGWDEVTVADNEAAFARARLIPRFLTDVSDVRTETTILGSTISAPAGFAPTALHAVVHPEGELVGARAFAELGLPFVLSTLSNCSMEAVDEAAPDGVRWFQLYVNVDRSVARSHVERAEAAGYRAIVVTVDVPADGHRPRDLRNAFEAPGTFGNFSGDHVYDAPFGELLGGLMDPSLTWADIGEIRGWTSLPVVVKGLLSPEDARIAVDHGVAGIWVSNHGGRQLDRAITSLEALAPIVDAVDGRAEVYLDSGVRDGVDVVTALATGARAVFLGRPWLYALAIGGEPGLRAAGSSLVIETKRAMALLGTATVGDIRRDHLAP